jgi:cyanate lyase
MDAVNILGILRLALIPAALGLGLAQDCPGLVHVGISHAVSKVGPFANCQLLTAFLRVAKSHKADTVNFITMTQTHVSVAAMAAACAAKAVDSARELGADLDYSEDSLKKLEDILSRMKQRQDGNARQEELDETCKMWGSYLGEVVRRRFGGTWSIETYPGKAFATLTLSVGGSKLFPSMKVHRRLTQGEGDDVWAFYKMVKARLEASPQAGSALVQ